jgi:hypothetical protein
MSSSDIIVLTHPEDWEPWLAQVRAIADTGIWPHIDPDQPAPAQGILKEATRPEIRDFDPSASTYAQLTATQQKTYDNARRYYDQDMKYYFRQEDLLRAVRTHISTHVSPQKKLLLKPTLTVRDWLVKLKQNTEPTDNYMRRKVLQQYMESLKGLKTTKINQWIDRWEHAMELALKYKLPQMSMGVWLVDLAQAVRPLSEAYFVTFTKRANKPKKSDPIEYVKVAMELREALASLSKKMTTTARGSAFNADFNADFAGDDPAGDAEESKGRSRSRSRKRAGTISIEEESSSSKKSKNPKCPACGIKGHALPDCWTVFENKRPEGFKPTEALAKKVKDKLAKDKDIAAEVEKIRLQEAVDEA